MALAVSLVSTSCIPKIANLSTGDTVPEAVASHVATDSSLLVLPLWLDTKQYNFRDPYVIAASAIGTPEANVPRRTGFYFDAFVCGGPPKFVVGYLVVAEDGTFVWSDFSGERTSHDSAILKEELTALVSGQETGPHLRDLMEYGTSELGFHADEADRRATAQFLERIPNAE